MSIAVVGRTRTCSSTVFTRLKKLSECHRYPMLHSGIRGKSKVTQIDAESASNIPDARPHLMSRLWRKVSLSPTSYARKSILHLAGHRLYMCSTDLVDSGLLIEEADLPDTFNSWFRITSLHIWLVMVRVQPHGNDAIVARNTMVKAMWEDVQNRAKSLGGVKASLRRKGIQQFGDQFQASLFAYDEGLLSDDHVLAGAVWRSLFEMKKPNPTAIESMVGYIRKQVPHLERQDTDTIITKGIVTFLPFHGDKEDKDIKDKIDTIMNLSTKK